MSRFWRLELRDGSYSFLKILSPLAPSVYYYDTNVDTSVGQGYKTVAVSDVKACLGKTRHHERDDNTVRCEQAENTYDYSCCHQPFLADSSTIRICTESSCHVRKRAVQERDSTINVKQYESLLRI
jgi:hypothetical protein